MPVVCGDDLFERRRGEIGEQTAVGLGGDTFIVISSVARRTAPYKALL